MSRSSSTMSTRNDGESFAGWGKLRTDTCWIEGSDNEPEFRSGGRRSPFQESVQLDGRSAGQGTLCGKDQGDGGPAFGRTVDADAAVVGFDEALGGHKAQ